ncbi:YopX family protein [Paenibacillus sp. FSL R10-2791]|uniref:YopX family protein n=1 Tax=Paenibacillus sp. FSL R10-2791 TaxID=2954695 RepID=UPI0030F5C579
MSREIKFRAWDGTEMYTPIIGTEGEIFRDYRDVEDFNPAPHDNLMQYTGLKDKNGKEIYEGDICTAEQMLFPLTGTRTGIVKYHDGAYLLEDLDGKDGDFLFSETAETTVIGNIYETPELIHGT